MCSNKLGICAHFDVAIFAKLSICRQKHASFHFRFSAFFLAQMDIVLKDILQSYEVQDKSIYDFSLGNG